MIAITFLLFFAAVSFVFMQNFLIAGFLLLLSIGFLIAHFVQKSSYIRLREQNVFRYLSDIAASQVQRNEEIQKHLELLSDNKEFEETKRSEFKTLIQELSENKIKIAEILSGPTENHKVDISGKGDVNYSADNYQSKIQNLKESDTLYEKFVELSKNYTTDKIYEKIQERIEKLSDKITSRIETYNSSVAIFNSDLFGWDRPFVASNKNLAEFYRKD